jgi:starvation-inducible DNA-binding protein
MNYLEIEQKTLTEVAKSLNTLLSNYQVYYQNLRNYHWNVTGEHFFDLHQQFEDLYNVARENIDEVAERILTLRKKPVSTLKEYLEISSIKENCTMKPHEMVDNILSDHAELISCMRAVIEQAGKVEDEGTIDLIGGFLSDIEKRSWMLDAWSKEKSN